MTLNIESKSQLAKLFATENLSVEHNNVRTASFDLENRIVTLPIFKNPKGDVYDMLTAHECSHALYTPIKAWAKLTEPKYRGYVNVIEDTRIDKLIQKKYPGIVKNYYNGFDILNKDDFFGIKGKDLDNDLMLIDKINIYYKSTKRQKFNFSKEEKVWLDKIDNIKSFSDVLKIAKELYDWQQKQLKQLAKLPDFDKHPFSKNYKLDKNGEKINITVEIKADEKKVDNNSELDNYDKLIKAMEARGKVGNPDGYGGQNVSVDTAPALDCITDKTFEKTVDKLLDKTKAYRYVTIPDPKLKKCLVSYDQYLKDMRTNIAYYLNKKNEAATPINYYVKNLNWSKKNFLKFKKDSTKTVMYLVKEFEMKKAAAAYKRAVVDKTGVIDPLKLKNYKFSEDIFKRLTILPNSKNHGMIMLLDWSGSMSDIIFKTVQQLCNLIWFCDKINIPFEVYMFKNKNDTKSSTSASRFSPDECTFNYKKGDMLAENTDLVNVASHRMKKSVLHESLLYLYMMSHYYVRSYDNIDETGYNIPPPKDYNLTSTPLNEALVILNKLIPEFQSKYKVDKLSLVTLTDGEADGDMVDYQYDPAQENKYLSTGYKTIDGHFIYTQTIVKTDKKNYTTERKADNSNGINNNRAALTATMLKIMKSKFNCTTIGFFLTRQIRQHFERYVREYIYENNKYVKNANYEKMKKSFTKDKVLKVFKEGYDSYFVINSKDMNIENYNLDKIDTESTSNIKKMFSKSMKNRIHSRVLLNKFIEQIA